jgi:hypothetical protein
MRPWLPEPLAIYQRKGARRLGPLIRDSVMDSVRSLLARRTRSGTALHTGDASRAHTSRLGRGHTAKLFDLVALRVDRKPAGGALHFTVPPGAFLSRRTVRPVVHERLDLVARRYDGRDRNVIELRRDLVPALQVRRAFDVTELVQVFLVGRSAARRSVDGPRPIESTCRRGYIDPALGGLPRKGLVGRPHTGGRRSVRAHGGLLRRPA